MKIAEKQIAPSSFVREKAMVGAAGWGWSETEARSGIF
jgi:hypothetical protein